MGSIPKTYFLIFLTRKSRHCVHRWTVLLEAQQGISACRFLLRVMESWYWAKLRAKRALGILLPLSRILVLLAEHVVVQVARCVEYWARCQASIKYGVNRSPGASRRVSVGMTNPKDSSSRCLSSFCRQQCAHNFANTARNMASRLIPPRRRVIQISLYINDPHVKHKSSQQKDHPRDVTKCCCKLLEIEHLLRTPAINTKGF
jgi:hypothetical protein